MVSNKKGQQMTLGTIIAIVLGIAVLVFLIFGFSTGWNNMWDKITAFGGGEANVDTIVQACQIACSSQSVDAFCRQSRTMKFGETRNVTWVNNTVAFVDEDEVEGSCEDLTKYKLGVGKCSAITCT